jgi:hypothetical protein
MGEATGNIAFLNVHDYISDFDGRKWRGCLALLKGEDSKDVSLYTESDLLVAGLVMAYLSKARVTVSYGQSWPSATQKDFMMLRESLSNANPDQTFVVKAIWNR